MKTSQWRWAVENRCVFSARLKALSDRSGDRIAGGRRYTNGYFAVLTVKNSQKTVKTAKMTIGVPILTCLHRVRRIHKAERWLNSILNIGLCRAVNQ